MRALWAPNTQQPAHPAAGGIPTHRRQHPQPLPTPVMFPALPCPQIQQLEATLAQYGYRDLYAPLPPEHPLDMLELTAGGRGQRQQPQHLGAGASVFAGAGV